MDYDTAKELLDTVKEVILSPSLVKYPKSDQGKLRFALSLFLVQTQDGWDIVSGHPAFEYLNRGVRPRVQYELMGKTIPIRTREGKIIFRKATPKSFAEGKWKHPGIPPQRYFEKAIALYAKRSTVNKIKLAKKALKKLKEEAGLL